MYYLFPFCRLAIIEPRLHGTIVVNTGIITGFFVQKIDLEFDLDAVKVILRLCNTNKNSSTKKILAIKSVVLHLLRFIKSNYTIQPIKKIKLVLKI